MRHALLVLVCLSLPALAGAQPSISSTSGTWAHGNSLTISGSSFGTHSDWGGNESFLNAAWNDFASTLEDGNLELVAPTDNNRMTRQTASNRGTPGGAYYRKVYDQTPAAPNPRLGSLSHWVCKTDGGQANCAGVIDRLYVSFWHRIGAFATQASGKHWRVYFDGPFDVWTSSGQGITEPQEIGHMQAQSTKTDVPQIWGSYQGMWIAANTWVWNEYLLCLNGCGAVFGSSDYIETRVNGVRWWRRGSELASLDTTPTECSTGCNERTDWVSASDGAMDDHTVDFGNMINGEPDCAWCDDDLSFYDFSDAYVNYGFQRVCVSAQATWAAVTQCEMQIPTAWSATSITVTANRGSYADFSSKYLYVCDYDNSCNSSGYALGAGAGGRSRVHVIGLLAVCLAGWVRWR